MNMGAFAGILIKAGNQYFVCSQNDSADRTNAVASALKTVNAAPDVHEAIFAAV